jgi:hypothetical protein
VTAMPIERGKVREYALATGAVRPEYLDDPHPAIPPTFLSTVVFWHSVEDMIRRPEVLAACAAAGVAAEVRNLLSLEQEYLFYGAVPRAGELLEPVSRFDNAAVKRPGFVLVHFAIEFRDPASGEVRAECRYTSAYRAAS